MKYEKQKVDYSLYLVTDRALSLGRSNLEVIEAAVSGGVTLVQLREKEASTQKFYREGIKIKDYLEAAHIPLIIESTSLLRWTLMASIWGRRTCLSM